MNFSGITGERDKSHHEIDLDLVRNGNTRVRVRCTSTATNAPYQLSPVRLFNYFASSDLLLRSCRFPGFFMSKSGVADEKRKGSDEEYMKPSSFKSLGERSKEKKGLGRRIGGGQRHPRLVVLVNEGTASSAEVFTAALEDNGHATVIGTRTYGKGLIQHVFPLSEDQQLLKLTIGEYLTPRLQHVSKVGGAKAEGGGIKPNCICRSEGIPDDKTGDFCVLRALEELGVEDEL